MSFAEFYLYDKNSNPAVNNDEDNIKEMYTLPSGKMSCNTMTGY